MKRRLSQADADRIRAEYEQWDKFGADSESATELAQRLGISKASLYRLKERHWRVDGRPAPTNGEAIDVPTGSTADLAEAVRWLTSELVVARVRIAELERELGRG